MAFCDGHVLKYFTSSMFADDILLLSSRMLYKVLRFGDELICLYGCFILCYCEVRFT